MSEMLSKVLLKERSEINSAFKSQVCNKSVINTAFESQRSNCMLSYHHQLRLVKLDNITLRLLNTSETKLRIFEMHNVYGIKRLTGY